MAEKTSHPRILAALEAERWAIQPEAMERIVLIAHGLNESPEAVAAKLGRPLDNTRKVVRRGATAIVPITGPVFRYANLMTEVSGATSIQALAMDFQAAVDDPSVESIILEIDSPGGQVAGVSEFAAQVRDAAANKPVIAYVSDLGASAAYWIASAASEVVARDTARLGSIGVVLRTTASNDPKEMKFISSQSPRKHATPDSVTGQELLQAEVDTLAQVFIDSVAKYRNTSPKTVMTDFGRGGVLVGQAAVDAGLADRLGSLESVIAELNSKQSPSFNRGTSMATSAITRDMLASEHPALLTALLEEGKQAGYAEGMTAGASAERQRILDVQAQALPGHEALIERLAFDGSTSGAEAAIQVINAEKALASTRMVNRQAELPKPLPFALADEAEQQPKSEDPVIDSDAIYSKRTAARAA